MNASRLVTLCALAIATPALAGDKDIGLVLNAAAFPAMSQLALEKLPTKIALPAESATFLSCPFGADPISLNLGNGEVDMNLSDFVVTPQAGAINVTTHFSGSGSGNATLVNGVACLGSIACDVTVQTDATSLSATLGLQIADGKVTTAVESIDYGLQPSQMHVQFANCVLADVPQSIVNWIVSEVFTTAKNAMLKQVSAALPPILDQQLEAQLGTSGAIDGLSYAARVSNVSVTPAGVTAYASLAVADAGPAAACVSAAASVTTSAPAATQNLQVSMTNGPNSPAVVGVSYLTLSEAMQAVWQAGMMCVNDDEVAKLGFDVNSLASLVPGLPKGTQLAFTLALDAPPAFATDADGALRMKVPGATLDVTLTAPDAQPAHVLVSTALSVAVAVTVDGSGSGYLQAALKDLQVESLTIKSGQATATAFALDPARLQVLLQDVLLPLAQQKLGTMPLAPASMGADGMYVWVDSIALKSEGLYAGLHPFIAAASDVIPPTTMITSAPARFVRPGRLPILAGGVDDLTPPQLLRYTTQLDTAAISAPAFGAEVFVPVTTAGTHTVTVTAVDLSGNVDPAPQAITFTVDDVPPALQIISQPGDTLSASSVALVFSASDDRSAASSLTYAVRVEESIPGHATTTRPVPAPVAFGAANATVNVNDLKGGAVYRATVMVYDAAGNVTSTPIVFAVTSTGCNAGPSGNAPIWATLLVMAFIAFYRGRRALV